MVFVLYIENIILVVVGFGVLIERELALEGVRSSRVLVLLKGEGRSVESKLTLVGAGLRSGTCWALWEFPSKFERVFASPATPKFTVGFLWLVFLARQLLGSKHRSVVHFVFGGNVPWGQLGLQC